MEELSLRAGYTNQTMDSTPKRLLTVANLRSLKKGWDYTDVYFANGSTVCIVSLPDINQYEFVSDCKEQGTLPRRRFPALTAYTSKQMLREVILCKEAYDSLKHRILSPAESKAANKYKYLFKDKKEN